MISEIIGIRKEMKNQNQKLRPLLFANIPAAICGKKSIPNNNASIKWSLRCKDTLILLCRKSFRTGNTDNYAKRSTHHSHTHLFMQQSSSQGKSKKWL